MKRILIEERNFRTAILFILSVFFGVFLLFIVSSIEDQPFSFPPSGEGVNDSYNLTYTASGNMLNLTCYQAYMNSTPPEGQTIFTPSIIITNNNETNAIYNITLGLNSSLPSGFTLYAWPQPYRPDNQTQNWSNTGHGIVTIPIQITDNVSTVVLRRIKANSTASLWFWSDCTNVSDNLTMSFNLTWGGGTT